ncbi:MAG: hypothetical protein IJ831_09455, partial [Spirochaetales bacterium]|nr:hypothetical protein [Spirochaetales bacterium]
ETGSIYPVFLDMKNPLDLRTQEGIDFVKTTVWQSLLDQGIVTESNRSLMDKPTYRRMFLAWSGILQHLDYYGYDGMIADRSADSMHGPMTEYAVLRPEQIKSAIANNGNFDPANPDIRFQTNNFEMEGKAALEIENVRRRYSGSFQKKGPEDTVSREDVRTIKRIVYDYPKIRTRDNVLMPYGVGNNSNELPMNKEYLTAALYQVLEKDTLILLPRFMDVMLNGIAGKEMFKNYSLSDGISAIAEDGRTFEFKMFGWNNRYGQAKDALNKADVGILVTRTSSKKAKNFMEEIKLRKGRTLYLFSVARDGKLIKALKKVSSPQTGEAIVDEIQWSHPQPEQNDLVSITDYIRNMPDVNINDQTPMDYSLIEEAVYQETKEGIVFQEKREGTYAGDMDLDWANLLESADSEIAAIEAERALSADYENADEIFPDRSSFDSELPENWDPDYFYGDDIRDALDYERKLATETPKVAAPSRYRIVPAMNAENAAAEGSGNGEGNIVVDVQNENMEYREFARANRPDVEYSGSDDSKDRQFARALRNDRSFRQYLAILGEALHHNTSATNAYYREERVDGRTRNVRNIWPYVDEQYRVGLKARIESQVTDPAVVRASRYALLNRDFPKTTGLENAAREEMIGNARAYRNILAILLDDRDMLPSSLIPEATGTRLYIPGREELDLMSVGELAALGRKANAEGLVDRILGGKLRFNGDVDVQELEKIGSSLVDLSSEHRRIEEELSAAERSEAELEKAVSALSTGIGERDALLRQADTILEALRKAAIGEVASGNREALFSQYRDISARLRDLTSESAYQSDATAKGSREKGLARGMSLGTSRYMKDLQTLVPEVFNGGDGRTLVWSDGKDTGDNAEIRKNIEKLTKDLKAQLAETANRITGSTLRQLGANADRISSALDRIAGSRDAGVASVDSEVLERMRKENDELKTKVRTLGSRLASRDARIESLSDDFREFRDYSRQLEKENAEKQKQKEKLYSNLQKAEADKVHLERQMGLQKTFDRKRREDELKALKKEMAEQRRRKKELENIREEKKKIARAIMKPVDLSTTDYDTSAKGIMAIQALVDPAFRRDWVYDLENDPSQETGFGTMTIDQAKKYFQSLDEAQRIDLMGYMPQDLIDRLTEQRRPLNDWTVAELGELARSIEDLRRRGQEIYRAKREYRKRVVAGIQRAILEAQGAVEGEINPPGTIDRLAERRKPKHIINGIQFSTFRMQELAQLVDGGFGNRGEAYRLLVDEMRYHRNRKLKAIEARQEKIASLLTDSTIENLLDTVEIDLGTGLVKKFTIDQLAYVYLSRMDEQNRAAVAYGALLDESEKGTIVSSNEEIDPMTGEKDLVREWLDPDNPNLIRDDDELRMTGDRRFAAVYSRAVEELNARGLMDLVNAIDADLNDESNSERLQRAAIDTYNRPFEAREHYLTIYRTDLKGEKFEDDMADALFNLNSGRVQPQVRKGMLITRQEISPRHQTGVDLSLLNTWQRAVEDQEHLIEYSGYIRKLRDVFDSRGSAQVTRALTQAHGPALAAEISSYIDLLANPRASGPRDPAGALVKTVRGRLASAYLGWKMSGIVLQAITSPLPALSEIGPLQLIDAYRQIAMHPIAAIEEINSLSIFMKNRTMNVIIDEALRRQNQWDAGRVQKLLNRQEELGQIGLTLVDRYAVAGGWLAMYRKALGENMEMGMDSQLAQEAAVKRADDFILRTQPVGNAEELASLFRSKNEFAKAFLQFQASLNVIWNNIYPNVVGYARNHELGKILGTFVGYGMAGLILGLVADGFRDDDDSLFKKLKRMAYWSLTQVLDSVPVFGNSIDGAIQQVLTGKKDFYGNGLILAPGVDKALRAVGDLTKGKYGKALGKIAESAALYAGLPASGFKEAMETIFGEHLAFLGRR